MIIKKKISKKELEKLKSNLYKAFNEKKKHYDDLGKLSKEEIIFLKSKGFSI